MTLEVLAKSPPAEPGMKSSGRNGSDRDGSADGFSTALSKAGRASTSGEKDVPDDRRTARDVKAEGTETSTAGTIRRSVRSAMQEAGEHSPAEEIGTKRETVSAAFPMTNGKVQRSLQDSSKSEIDAEAEDADAEATIHGADPSGETASPASSEIRGAADLMNILAGLNSATAASVANAGAQRTANPAEGRKGTVEGIEGSDEAGVDADGSAVRSGTASDALLDMPTSDEADVGPKKDFRFINAKNGSLNAELTQAASSNERGGADAKSGASSVENVVVLDSRRIVGLPSGSNSALLMAAMVGDQSWSAAMQPDASLSNIAAQSSSGSVVHMLKLQMNPHDLGAVTATLKMSGEQLHVHLTVETRAAMQQLSDDSTGMLDALRAQGFSVEQVTISVAPTADSDGQKGQQGAQTGQQMAGNGERQGGTNRDHPEQRFDETGDSRNFNNDSSSDTSPTLVPGASGGTRSGQLYL